jgi:hypothetical protein
VRGRLVWQQISGPDEAGAIGVSEDLRSAVVVLELLSDDRPGDSAGRGINRDDILPHDHAVGERHDARVAFHLGVDDESAREPAV